MRSPVTISVKTNPGGTAPCANEDCTKNPDLINKDGTIKQGTLRAQINSYYYCKECIPKVHKELIKLIKTELDCKFWLFK